MLKPDRLTKRVLGWCEQYLKSDFFHSDGFEMFYFRETSDAELFQLMAEQLIQNHNSEQTAH